MRLLLKGGRILSYEHQKDLFNSIPIISDHRIKEKIDYEHSYVHLHQNIELLYFYNGEGEVFYAGEVINVSAGDMVIINSMSLHSIYSLNHLEYMFLIIDEDFAEMNGIAANKLRFKKYIKGDDTLVSLLMKIDNIKTEKYLCTRLNIAAVLITLLQHLFYNCLDNSAQENDISDQAINKAIMYICSNVQKKINVEELAMHVGYSKFHFEREFKKQTLQTPLGFINKHKCEYAKKILVQRKYSIKEVAHMVGFENSDSFSKMFYKIMGEKPADYLKRLEKD